MDSELCRYRSILSRHEFGRAVDDYLFDFSSGFIHPNADFVRVENAH
jgi:hypothetical protein